MRLFCRTGTLHHARRVFASVAVAATVLSTAACTIDNNGGHGDDQPAAEKSSVEFQSNVKDGDTDVAVADLITVSSSEKLGDVSLTNDAGKQVKGTLSEDGKKWTAKEKLGYGRSYELKAKSEDKSYDASFTTQSPASQTSAALSPLYGSTVGIGQSISFHFDTPITDRKAVQKLIDIETTPKVEGAFYWISSTSLRWRPEEYWKPGTKVHVKANFYGEDLGDGVYGQEDREASFTIGDAMRAVVDDAAKTMTIYKNGKVVQTMPVSNGRDGGRWATPNGIYQVGDQYEKLLMDSETFGYSHEDGGYRTDVKYATQLSYSGVYIHAAPWSVWAQGKQNTSHGCVNVSDANAKWVYDNMKRGDIVEVKNSTGSTFDGHDGLGDWNIPWSTWSKGNADK
ncbi:L,D-transpeptidase [Corynebacterium anserum]|uniref:L,D-transpeptidase family protein n=1 Tax=Corynebacterium anserum TaxID=2684406 RepID=A0A7G7YMG7_9CORY|nr:Ig-like domain-containing protein [Corynebacterium anserum]QNH95687.1 L,D-transpeptidase family protein [Corynebacterium anserum]